MCNLFWFGVVTAHLVCIVLATPLDPVPIGRGFALNEFVRHWEAARYTPNPHAGARRARRSATAPAPGPLELSFKAHNREFHLRLRPDPNSVFANGVEFHGTRGTLDFNVDSVYSGTLEDDELSSVHGVLTSNGLFDGTITTRNNEIYYIEPLERYGKTHPNIHSVIYKVSDVDHPYANSTQPCASHVLHLKTSNQDYNDEQGTFLNYNEIIDLHNIRKVKSFKRTRRWVTESDDDTYVYDDDEEEDSYENKNDEEPMSLKNPSLPIDLYVPYYSENENSHNNGILISRNLSERTRGILINTYEDENYNVGTILSRPKSKTHIEIKTKVSNTDEDIINKRPIGYTFVSPLSSNISDSLLRHVNKRATIDPNKTTCMLYLQADHQFFQKFGSEEACIEVMTRHVQRVNSIYKVTDFNQDGKPDNITFMIKRIKVHTVEAVKDPLYRFPNNYGVEKFLELFSEEDYDGFCLAYMFTYRDFEMGTLGLAWTGDLKNAGGVCEKNGHYRGSLKSLNTGIVTLLNYGKHVPPAVSHVTLAHEIGHNFGSPHDPDVCTPGGEDGNFIMFARATSGDKKNNNHFSPCSLKSINPVLNNKARSSKGCFTEPQVSLCGNGVVEEGEECDCGWEGDCREPCCYPQRRHPPPGETPCRLTPRSLCSPSQGPCCTSQCTLRFGDQCRSDNGCRDASQCDGRRPSCPPSASKPNRTLCDDGFICYMGECTGSICIAYGLESCQCSSERACELCCKLPGPGNPCKSSFIWNQPPYDVPDLFAKPGTPCNDYNGYCDVFQKCREVDPSGPLATLRKLLLSEESLSSFKKWLMDHWYAGLLVLLAVIGLLVGSTRLFGKKSDGKVKKVTIIHSATTETVRLPDHCPDGVIVHTAVRSKVPLKKKVALKTRGHRKTKDSHDPEHLNIVVTQGKYKKRVPKKTTNKQESPKHTKNGTSSQIEAVAIKFRKAGINKNKIAIAKRKTKKEVIDYSATQKEREQNTVPVVVEADAVGKVQNWLLNSPQSAVIPKSKSTPVGLAEKTQAAGAKYQTKALKNKHDKGNSKSVNNLSQGEKEKVSLHVIYRPPFKFSLKLCKGDKSKMVLDKNIHNRLDRNKKKPHTRNPNKTENKLSKSASNSNNTGNSLPVDKPNEVNTPQGSGNMNSGSGGAPQTVDAGKVHEQKTKREFSNLPMEARLSQYRNLRPKWSHRKSNSMGQDVQLTDSCQNLLQQDNSNNSSDMHFYENLTFVNSSPDHRAANTSSKTSSIPRSTSPKQKNKHLSRQSSHIVKSTTPAVHNHLPHRIVRMHSENTNMKKSPGVSKGNSLNNIDLVGRKNSLSDTKRRLNSTLERTYANVKPVNRQNSLTDKQKKLEKSNSPPDTMANSAKLRRQMSATELYKSCNRSDLPLPISAGANIQDAYRSEFDWTQNKRCNIDYKVPVAVSDARKCQDTLESHLVPNKSDNQITLENIINKRHSRNASASKISPSQKRQDINSSIPSSSDVWSPPTFNDLKNSLPSESHSPNPAPSYQSDMEVLVSDNDQSLYDCVT